MSLKDLLKSSETELTEGQISAFFLGTFMAKRPVPFKTAMEEVLMEAEVENFKAWEADMKAVYDQMKAHTHKEMKNLIEDNKNAKAFLENALGPLDYFLTGYAVSGATDDEEISELIEDLEDTVLDIEDFLADEDADAQRGSEIKEAALDSWNELVALKEG